MKKFICLISLILTCVCLAVCTSCGGDDSQTGVSTVNVTLDLDGGSIESGTSFQVDVWEDASIPIPTKEGYDFKGWSHNGNFVSLTPWMIEEENVTIKANWQKRSYQVYLDFNGGLLYEDGLEITKKNAVATYGEKVEFPTPLKEGYNFLGWYYGERKVELDSWALDVGKVILKAKWEIKKQQVTFDFNGGNIAENPQLTEKAVEVEYNQEIPFPSVEKRGYNFSGWSFSDGTILNSTVWTYDESVTELTAVWEPVYVAYDFDLNGGTLNAAGGKLLFGTSTQFIKSLSPVKEGYTFKRWKVNGVQLSDVFEYLPLENSNKVVITADYTPKTYVITIDAGEGSLASDDSNAVIVKYGVETTLPVPTAIGKTFVGYKIENTDELITSSSGTLIWQKTSGAKLVATYSQGKFVNFVNYDGSVETFNLEDVAYLGESDLPVPKTVTGYGASWELSYYDIVSLTETTEIKAVLKPNSYAVVFKSGLKVVATRNFVYGEEVVLPSGDEVKNEGYTLLGWSTSRTEVDDYMCGTVVWKLAKNTELYAVWVNENYKITYDTSSIETDFKLVNSEGNYVSSVQSVTYQQPYTLYSLSAKDNAITVTWLNEGKVFAVSGTYDLKKDVVLVPKITYNPIQISVNLDLNGGSGSTIATITLNSQFKNITPTPQAPTNKAVVAYSYKDRIYFPTDNFKILNYDGTPIKVLYEDYIFFTINVDVNGGTGEKTAIAEYGEPLGNITPRPVAPSGMKIVGFLYNGVEYPLSYVWDFSSYDGGVFKAIYVEDNVDWSPIV